MFFFLKKKTVRNLTQLYTYNTFTNFIFLFQKPYTSSHNFTKLHKTFDIFKTKTCTILYEHFTKSYNTLRHFTILDRSLHHFTKILTHRYSTLQNLQKSHTIAQNFTTRYKQTYTKPYKTLHNYTQVFK